MEILGIDVGGLSMSWIPCSCKVLIKIDLIIDQICNLDQDRNEHYFIIQHFHSTDILATRPAFGRQSPVKHQFGVLVQLRHRLEMS